MTTKKMTIREFVDGGYLQELNRLMLHPLGLALAFGVPDATDEDPGRVKTTAFVIDARDDPEGMIFSEGMVDLQWPDRGDVYKIRFYEGESFSWNLMQQGPHAKKALPR